MLENTKTRYNLIQICGGLGNQMFQYTYYLYAKNKSGNYGIDTSIFENSQIHNGYELEKVFNIRKNFINKAILKFIKLPIIRSKFVAYYSDEELANDNSLSYYKNYDFPIKTAQKFIFYFGYYQSLKYLNVVADEVRTIFKFDQAKLSAKSLTILQKILGTNSVSIHIRRGDYVGSDWEESYNGNVCSLNYYLQSTSHLSKLLSQRLNYFIFTNDPAWVRKYFALENSTIIDWNSSVDSWQDMYLMSKCKHNIIANSTFSWWAAWLNVNSNKIVIAPKRWYPQDNQADRIPLDWILI